MMTWRLWRALNRQPTLHPVYRRILARTRHRLSLADLAGIEVDAHQMRIVIRLILGIGLVLFAISGGFTLLLPVTCFLPVALVAAVIFSGTIYGAINASRTSDSVTSQQMRGIYDLLATTPSGALGMWWATSTGHLFQRTYQQVKFLLTILGAVLLGAILFSTVLIVLRALNRPDLFGADLGRDISNIVYALTLLAALAADFVQPVIIGSLMGMIVPGHSHNRFDAQFLAVAAFLVIQFGSYVVTWLVGFGLAPSLLQISLLPEYGRHIVVALLRLAVFFGLREVIIVTLWHVLMRRLNSSTAELDAIAYLAV